MTKICQAPKIIFIGTPEFGAIVLEKLIKGGYKPILVVTAADKPTGRKQIITPPPVKVIAQKYNIPVEQPEIIKDLKLKSKSARSSSSRCDSIIKNLKPDLGVVAAYGQIIPGDILDIPKFGFLNVHPSLLPRWRGPSPIQLTILEGDKKTGVTIIKMIDKVDAGPIIAQEELKIEKKETYTKLYNELGEFGGELLVKTIPPWIAGKIKARPQDNSKATYSRIIKKEDGRIDWKNPAEEIERKIRAFASWPGTYTSVKLKAEGEKMLKISKASILQQTKNGPKGEPGKTFLAPDSKIAVQTGKDFLIIEELQLEGKKPMPASDFLRGRLNFIGVVLK